jgi:RNA polymerase sigma-70 factor, ECF subfamily
MTTRPASQTDSWESRGHRSDAASWLEVHGDALYRYARARAGSREVAEDLVQETLLAALEARDRFQNRSSVRTWLLSILRHKIIDHYRRREPGRQPTQGNNETTNTQAIMSRFFTQDGFWCEPPSRWKSPEQALMDDEFWRVVDGCLGDLPRSLAQAFVLRELDSVAVAELCAILDLSPGNLRVRLHRARLLLRACLEERWFDSQSNEATKP